VAARPSERESRRNFGRPENLWYRRHRSTLERWPVLDEAWARAVEAQRLAAERPEGAPPGSPGA
jgi:hypothetical protein